MSADEVCGGNTCREYLLRSGSCGRGGESALLLPPAAGGGSSAFYISEEADFLKTADEICFRAKREPLKKFYLRILVYLALNPQPSTLNPQPSTLNPQPSTLNLNLSKQTAVHPERDLAARARPLSASRARLPRIRPGVGCRV